MRKCEENVSLCVKEQKAGIIGNTTVAVANGCVSVFLHGNCIYKKDATGKVRFTLAGWPTTTTVSRLRSLGIDVRIKNRVPVYKGKEISCCDWINC